MTGTIIEEKRVTEVGQILEILFQRAEQFTQRYLRNHTVSGNQEQAIRSIYQLMLIPDAWLGVLPISKKLLLKFQISLSIAKNDAHPLLRLAQEKLKVLLTYK